MADVVARMTEEAVTILLVDDEPENLVALESVLAELGQELVLAHSGREALRHLLTTEFAVLVLDVRMDDLDGFETADLIRQREKTRHTPIIFLTGAESDAEVIRGYSVGAVDYMLKPFEPEILRSKVSVFVELARRHKIIERQAAQLQESHAQTLELAGNRARLMKDLEASLLLSTSLDFPTTLERVAELAVPRLAEWCLIDLLQPDGTIVRTGSRHCDPDKARLMHRFAELPPFELVSNRPAAHVVRTGLSELVSDCTPAALIARGVESGEAKLLQELGTETLVVVPLPARDHITGALVLGRGRSGLEFTSAELAFAEDFATRAGLALHNARLYQQAQEAISVRDNFLNIASHELRTPLTSLRLQVDALHRELRKSGSATDNGVGAKVDMVQRQTGRLERLINELLDVSRIAAGRLPLKFESVDLAAIALEVCENAPEELASGDVAITVRAPHPVVGEWDRQHLREVLTNLLANALKYGSGKPIEVCVEATPRAARLVVRDHGIGIAPGDRTRIFERFERAASQEHYGGFGLGLWIARQIADALGGRITVESELGVGSTFTVELPRRTRRNSNADVGPRGQVLEARIDTA